MTTNPTFESLSERWSVTLDRTLVPHYDPGIFQAIWRAYHEKHRVYHTGQHLAECFTLLDECGIEHEVELEYALWFHDVVYDTWYGNANEAASAAKADRHLIDMNLPSDFRARVRRLIFATKDHAAPGWIMKDVALLLDVDLSILGADEARFDEYEAGIRAEYHHVPEHDFRAGRSAFLRKMLELRSDVFRTDWFRERFEAKARANLQRSFEKLDAVEAGEIMTGAGW